MQSVRTLLVEDDVDVTKSIEVKLNSTMGGDFEVEHLRTLSSAVSRVSAGNIDVVLLDLELPDSSGVDSIIRMHAAAPDVPIVVVTDTKGADMALRALQARAEDYLVKSRTGRTVLRRTIRHALERHRVQLDLGRHVSALTKSEARYRSLVANGADGVVVVSRGGEVLFVNSSAARLFDRPSEELEAAMFGFPFETNTTRELKVGAQRIVEVHAVESEWDGTPAWFASLFDITRHKRFQADLEAMAMRVRSLNVSLEHLASVDPLTGLLNRRGLEAELAIEVRRKQRSGAPLAAVLIDCDDFKRINETLGHSGGDAVLRQLADRLKESLRPSDHIGRIGGDEFLILLPDTRFAEAYQVAERLRLSVSGEPLRNSEEVSHVTASLGIELVPDGLLSIDEVVVRTQQALDRSKRNGKNRVSTQDGRAADVVDHADNLVRELQSEAAFGVLRRPIVRLDDESTVAWELVARGPQGVFESPRDYYRVALERNILTQVDLRCLKSCLAAACDSSDSSRYHVNVHPATLLETHSERIVELFTARARRASFCVEMSEQNIIGDPSLLREHVRALKSVDVRVAVAGVGCGRSSLEALIVLEPDLVKIDSKFVQGTSRNPGKLRSLRRMLGVAASLGCELIADGVDSREELDALNEIGVPYGQGLLWAGLA